jgi:multidrug efflux system membrane fusion protein
LVAGCGKTPEANKSDKRTRALFPVEITTVTTADVTYLINAIGSLHPFENVSIISRVPGRVTAVHFQEGEPTTTDRVLVEIEPERYALAVAAASAALAKTVAMLDDAKSSLLRRETVNRDNPGLVRDEDVQAARARLAAAEAEKALAQTKLDLATLDYRDAHVRASVAGIVQNRLVQTGQYVETGTLLASLQRRDPLLVKCRVPQSEAYRIKIGSTLKFTIENSDTIYQAMITHISAGADTNTRLVDITAHVNDPAQDKLMPGSFARITIPINTEKAIVIPSVAVRPSERGFLAYVISGTDEVPRVEERVLKLGMRTADGQVEVSSGLAAGERIVIRGGTALNHDAKVQIQRLPLSATAQPTQKP